MTDQPTHRSQAANEAFAVALVAFVIGVVIGVIGLLFVVVGVDGGVGNGVVGVVGVVGGISIVGISVVLMLLESGAGTTLVRAVGRGGAGLWARLAQLRLVVPDLTALLRGLTAAAASLTGDQERYTEEFTSTLDTITGRLARLRRLLCALGLPIHAVRIRAERPRS